MLASAAMLGRPLVQRHKTAARIALYLVPVLLTAATWAGIRYSRTLVPQLNDWQGTDYSTLEPVQLLRDYLRIDTSAPGGNEIPGAELLARHLEAAGVPVHLERVGERNANLWAILEGEERQAVVLHNHIDITPVEDIEEWRVPPFEAVIDGPWVFGPGAFDMKSVAIAQLVAFLDVARGGVTPRRSLIFLATGDEETGSALGSQRVLREHPELVERFAVVLTEGGVVEARSPEDVKYWGTEVAQKRFLVLEIRGADRERLEALRATLAARAEELRTTPHLTPTVARFFAEYAASRDAPPYREALLRVGDRLEKGEDPGLPPFASALLVQGMVVGEVRPRPEEDGHRIEVQVELLPGADLEEVLPRHLVEGFEVVRTRYPPPVADDPTIKDHFAFRALDDLIRERYEAPHGTMIVPWTITDARFFRGAGVPTLGFSPFIVLATDTFKLEGADERIPLPAFVEGVELYRELVRRLVGLPGAATGNEVPAG